jgi:hypothetical protein
MERATCTSPDTDNHRIRKVSGGTITTVAGNGSNEFAGDGGPAISASLNFPVGVAVDTGGALYIGDRYNHRIRKVANGIINTVAGRGFGFSGDGGPATDATFKYPRGVAVDSAGNLFIGRHFQLPRSESSLRRPSSYSVTPSSVSFSAQAGGAVPGGRSAALSTSVPGLAYSASADAPWVSVTPSTGAIPANLQITADPSQLGPGNYSATVTIRVPNATPPNRTISVSFAVSAPPPGRLIAGPTSIGFAVARGTGPVSEKLTVSNQGGGAIRFTATASTADRGNWLRVTPASGTVSAAAPVVLTVVATPGPLGAGTYTGSIDLEVQDTGQQIHVPVTLALSPPLQKILLSQTGLSFTAVAQGGAPLSQSFGILNIGQGSMDWTATVRTLSGGSGWLRVDPASGTVARPFTDVSLVNVSVDASRLTAGDYYGQIQVRSPGAPNSPQTIFVVLSVLPPGSNPGPEVRPQRPDLHGTRGRVARLPGRAHRLTLPATPPSSSPE